MFVDFVNSVIDKLESFRDCYWNGFEFDEALLSEAQLRLENTICFHNTKVQGELGTLRRGQDS